MAKCHQDPTIFKRFLNWLLEPVKIPGADMAVLKTSTALGAIEDSLETIIFSI